MGLQNTRTKGIGCITINTDASLSGEHHIGGYAFVIVSDQFRIKQSGCFKSAVLDSTQAELMAIGNALHTLIKMQDLPMAYWLIINTDSVASIRKIKDPNCPTSKKVNALWKKVIHRIKSKKNRIRHVKAHTTKEDARSYVNRWCDENAKFQMRAALSKHLNNLNISKPIE